MYQILCFACLFISASLYADAITLTNEYEIQRANELSLSIDDISEKVTTCINSPNGSMASCACSNIDFCRFKSEFKKTASLYCKIKTEFPEWANKPVNYYLEGSNVSHALGMEGLELQFGKYCK